ncbi:MAG TPA: rRNA maturation RNase YbeY [Candidatus Pelethenecus faecipullorum]|uniref:Endoribonuclease YbeY n=1 Tax=Candidatus Pelethenecus faecipullorum TaxID=2840900 RepID=A0A9D1GQN1_9MOLU|nr:rRNA maturation RNase YbeY [Candidatus Pelethenecus faecipullorum]
MKIEFFNQTQQNTKPFEKLIRRVFRSVDLKKEFNLIFVTDEEIKRLNQTYRKIDRVTDVLSFALCDDLENEMKNSLGDIFIAVDQARRQASEYGHSLKREMAFLAVHGYLHLLGYDHQTKEEEEQMFAKQEAILLQAGLKRES